MRFENQVAIVTGAGRGIGQATALRLANEGARVACVSRTEANAKSIADQINSIRADAAKAYAVDVADHAAVQKIGAQILSDLGVKTMRLLTNNPRKFVGLQGYGLSISEAVPLEIPASDLTRRYLKTKKDTLGHRLSSV